MATMTVKLRNVPDTQATVGWAGTHTVTVDRPAGKAGGQGLGFNGGELLGLAIGGCFCNDLHYVAHDMNIRLAAISVEVTVSFEGDPPLATSAKLRVAVEAANDDDVAALIRRAAATSTVSNSVSRGILVDVSFPGGG